MAKLTQAEVKAKADEWARLGAEIEKKEAARNAALEPEIEAHNEAIKPILAKHDPKINVLTAKRSEIAAEVTNWLETQGKPMTLTGELAIAVVESKSSSRKIDVGKFLEKAKTHGSAMWECLSVAVAKAEKLIGKATVDEISTTDSKLVAVLKLK